MECQRKVVIFDFDGTLTTKDTLLEFIKFAVGTYKFYLGFLLNLPFLIAYKLGLYSNWKAKQRIFTYFFKGMSYQRFCKFGEDFSFQINKMEQQTQLRILQHHLAEGNKIYVISASIEEWVRPWCMQQGIKNILGTQIEVENGLITGKFKTKNCYGQEKVNRLLSMEPDRKSYTLIAYGDSRGDKELLNFADRGMWCK